MAAIVLVHPVHGAKVATSEQEADFDSLSGWSRYIAPTESTPAVVTDNAISLKKRPGRPRKVLP